MDAELIRLLAEDLRGANFGVDGLGGLLGPDASAALHRGQRVPALRALDNSPLATLARLFVLGLPVQPDQLDRALPRLSTPGAIALGLITPDGAPILDLRPYSAVDASGTVNWWIASDLDEVALGHELPADHVLGVGGASTTLTALIMPARVDVALDLGTGCGIQAMHAARFAHRVIATDISERAIRIASFNASLNGVTNIEFRLGSLFEPVLSERFDHVISNPPFVITPRDALVTHYEYRDGGFVGDGVIAAVIDSLESVLAPGGVAQLLGNWEYGVLGDATGLDEYVVPQESDGLERMRRRIAHTGLDAWVVERERQSVELYAETWIRDGGTKPGRAFDEWYGAWLDDFAARGVTEVGFGYLTLRRPAHGGPLLSRFERYSEPLGGSLGAHTKALLDAHDWLAAHDDDQLVAQAFTVAADVTEERHYWPGDEHPSAITLRQGGGFARSFPVGTALAAVVGACDGTLSLAAIVGAVAQLLELEEQTLIAEILTEVRELVETGVLLAEPTILTGRAHVPPT